jgi:hypothetical protein
MVVVLSLQPLSMLLVACQKLCGSPAGVTLAFKRTTGSPAVIQWNNLSCIYLLSPTPVEASA